MVRSRETDARRRPSGENATDVTGSACPFSSRRELPEGMFQMRIRCGLGWAIGGGGGHKPENTMDRLSYPRLE
jgi:hypothetical protein